MHAYALHVYADPAILFRKKKNEVVQIYLIFFRDLMDIFYSFFSRIFFLRKVYFHLVLLILFAMFFENHHIPLSSCNILCSRKKKRVFVGTKC